MKKNDLTNKSALALFPMFSDFFPLRRPRVVDSANCLWVNPLNINWTPGNITTLVGFSENSVFFSRKPDEHSEYKTWALNQPAMFLEADMTEEIAEMITKMLPAWFKWGEAKKYFGREGGIGSLSNTQSENDGIYTLKDTVCSNQVYALFYAGLDHVPLEEISFQPGYKLLFNNKESRFTGSPLSIWQSEEQYLFSRLQCPNEGEFVLPADNSRFLTAAMKVKKQRRSDVIREIAESDAFSLAEIKKMEKGTAGNYTGKFMTEVTLSSGRKFWLVTTAWAYLGEDGDAAVHETLYDRDEAEQKYNEADPK